MSNQEQKMLACDVAVIGGGMVGCALACALAQQQFQVVVVELREPKLEWPLDEVDLRVSALTRASQNILQNLGAWERMTQLRVSPYRKMQVWDANGSGRIQFDAEELGEPDLGHIVENRVTRLALWERLGEFENVIRATPESLTQLACDEKGVSLTLESGLQVAASLVVGAEGANSSVRDMAGITSNGWAYDQHAIVATIWPELHHGDVARQRFMKEGPLALLPIDDGRCSIVWSTSPGAAEQLMAMDDEYFCDALTQASEQALGKIQQVGPRGVFPLRLRQADNYVKPGLALVGDAAHGIHPLAGQGVNLGLLDAATLADVLVAARDVERPLGAMTTLRRYERARWGADAEMLGAMDVIKRLFSTDHQPLALIRNLGMTLADNSGPGKRLMVKRAMGLFGELPTLARPGIGIY